MLGGAAFILLKAGLPGPESAKQAEIRLASLLKILQIARFGGKGRWQTAARTCSGCIGADFGWIWLICRELCILLFRSQF
jgi:hypothetical protein